ncbi:hypothetical protein HXW73_09540 [Halomonas sp. SH5A2]|uniref:helix-hairpin-helix domain-containing protein n=1 Tax=Halomonas sp. SH5A2 TaxID=2749040 RepID=UPI001641A092|nr:helix-hairpin-helix domain-containing protein [Halomonas sp. SH5A2]QNI03149.1 hypothetical protein HXW73_09540 [Halomonas sp. SH5A2]
MTDTAQYAESALEAVHRLNQTAEKLIHEPASEALLISAMTHYTSVRQTLTADAPSSATLAALARTEQFIVASADAYYRQLSNDAESSLKHAERTALFGNRLMALDGIGPATANQLFERGIFTPEQLFAIPVHTLETLDLPPASLARIKSLYNAHQAKTPD